MSIVLIVISIKWWGKWFSLFLKMQICMKNLVFSLVEWIIIANHLNFFTTICSAQLLINVKGPFNWDLRWHSIRRTDLQQRQTFITKIWRLEKKEYSILEIRGPYTVSLPSSKRIGCEGLCKRPNEYFSCHSGCCLWLRYFQRSPCDQLWST